MSREKQIEEMVGELRDVWIVDWDGNPHCLSEKLWDDELENIAIELYNIGYRKQKEDVVEVVRCKDCVYFKQSFSAIFPCATAFICDFPYGLQKNVSENDFCCHGAKMKGENK